MPLIPGSRLGPYEIQAAIGAGGMGEVYRARDTRLQRDVAVKVLPDLFSSDPERRVRFEREAQLLASLHHPNIASVFGLEESNGVCGIVLELVEGETAAERISRGPIPLDEALVAARQITLALEAAHERGIIHRDLKPANIKLTRDGTVKVLDFGLAKALDPGLTQSAVGLSMSPTFTANATQAGVIMGTAPYMSPEQARGKAVDRRADIWAFGCMLYEMLSGTRAFPGDEVTDVLARVLEREPDWNVLPRGTPPSIRATLARCLQKDPSRRFHHIADVRLALDDASVVTAAPGPEVMRTPRRTLWLAIAAAAIVGAVSAGLLMRVLTTGGRAGSEQPVRLFTIPQQGFNTVGLTAISGDGRWIAFAPPVAAPPFRLYLRRIDSADSREIATSLAPGMNPFFSYDSRWVAYFTESGLFKVPVAGGVPERLVDVVGPNYEQGSWGPGDTIVMNYPVIDGSLHRGLAVVPASGGAARVLTTPQRPGSHSEPEVLPDGTTVLFTLTTEQTSSIAAMPVAGGSFRVIVPNARTPKYVESGHLVFQRLETGEIVVVPFDITRLEVAGDPVTLDSAARVVDSAAFAVSQEGTLIYSSPSDTTEEANFTLVSADRSGATTLLIKEHGSWAQPRVSPDGRFVVIRVVGNPNCDLWILDLQRGTRTRLTLEKDNHDPVWHPNGREVTWAAQSDGPRLLTIGRADGTGQSRVLAPGKDSRLAESWSPDGRALAFVEANPKTQEDIWFLSASDGEARPFLTSRFQERYPAFSRDGRWLAYTSTESGREEVYLQAYGGNGGRVQISSNGGTGPVWSRNGRELFYAEGSQMMVVDIDLAGEPKVSRPRVLFQGPFVWDRARNYDVTPDGRFVMVQRTSDLIQSATLRVLLNWQAKLGLQ